MVVPPMVPNNQTTVNIDKSYYNETDSGFDTWHLNNLFKTPDPRSSTREVPHGSPDEGQMPQRFLASSTPFPQRNFSKNNQQPSSFQLRNESTPNRSMTQIISDASRSNQNNGRILRENTRNQRLAVPGYVLERQMPQDLRSSDNSQSRKIYIKQNQRKK